MATDTLAPRPAAATTAIPRIIHRIWLGESPLPDEAREFGQTWERLHPDWEMRLWTDADLPPLRNQAAFDAATVPAQRADILRYELLAQYGGVYVDTDFECLKALDSLLDGVTAFVASECDTYVGNAVLGAAPGHPFFERVVDGLAEAIAAVPGDAVNQQSGPVMLTRALEQARADGVEVPHVFGRELFYPYSYDEPHRRGESFPQAFAVHHWAQSWLPDPAPAAPVAARFAVRYDWHTPAAMVAVARAFAVAFEPGDPVELAFVVDGDPDPDHAQHLEVLMHSVADQPGRFAATAVYGQSELADLDVAAGATSPVSDVHAGVELVDTLDLIRQVGQGLHAPPEPTLPATPPAPPAEAGGGLHGTYVGAGRMLVATTWGGRIYTPADDHSLTPELVAHGTYDEPFTAYLQRHLSPGDIVFDVGANVGLFTVLMAQLVGPSGHVVAYEALPANAQLVRENVATNWLDDRVTVLEAAAAAQEGRGTFSAVPGFAGNGTLAEGVSSPLGPAERIDVATEPVDRQLARHERVALVKIDVEGAEVGVLRGMREALAAGVVERLSIELREDTTQPGVWAELCDFLRGMASEGWTFAILPPDGTPRLMEIEQLLDGARHPQVVIERP